METQKKEIKMISRKNLQRAVFAGACPTIVAAGTLNFCVRYEYRCVRSAIAHQIIELDRSKLNTSLTLIKSSTD